MLVLDSERYVQKFVDFVATQDFVEKVDFDNVVRARHRDELGISSLNIILLVANYMEETGKGEMSFEPAWVARLNDVDGIISVLHEIDQYQLEEVTIGATAGHVDPAAFTD